MIGIIQQGNKDNIYVQIEANGLLANADGAVDVTIINSDNDTVDGGFAVSVKEGVYSYAVDTLIAGFEIGEYKVAWDFVVGGLNKSVLTNLSVVDDSSKYFYVSLDTYKSLTEMDITGIDDIKLFNILRRAAYITDEYIGGSVMYNSYRETVPYKKIESKGTLWFMVHHTPIQSVDSVSINVTPITTRSLDPSLLMTNVSTGICEYYGNTSLVSPESLCTQKYSGGTVNITYSSGLYVLPQDIISVNVVLADQMLNESRQQKSLISKFSLGRDEETYNTDNRIYVTQTVGKDYVKSILDKYKHPNSRNMMIV